MGHSTEHLTVCSEIQETSRSSRHLLKNGCPDLHLVACHANNQFNDNKQFSCDEMRFPDQLNTSPKQKRCKGTFIPDISRVALMLASLHTQQTESGSDTGIAQQKFPFPGAQCKQISVFLFRSYFLDGNDRSDWRTDTLWEVISWNGSDCPGVEDTMRMMWSCNSYNLHSVMILWRRDEANLILSDEYT